MKTDVALKRVGSEALEAMFDGRQPAVQYLIALMEPDELRTFVQKVAELLYIAQIALEGVEKNDPV